MLTEIKTYGDRKMVAWINMRRSDGFQWRNVVANSLRDRSTRSATTTADHHRAAPPEILVLSPYHFQTRVIRYQSGR
jgi:hypothetical protein